MSTGGASFSLKTQEWLLLEYGFNEDLENSTKYENIYHSSEQKFLELV